MFRRSRGDDDYFLGLPAILDNTLPVTEMAEGIRSNVSRESSSRCGTERSSATLNKNLRILLAQYRNGLLPTLMLAAAAIA